MNKDLSILSRMLEGNELYNILVLLKLYLSVHWKNFLIKKSLKKLKTTQNKDVDKSDKRYLKGF